MSQVNREQSQFRPGACQIRAICRFSAESGLIHVFGTVGEPRDFPSKTISERPLSEL